MLYSGAGIKFSGFLPIVVVAEDSLSKLAWSLQFFELLVPAYREAIPGAATRSKILLPVEEEMDV